MIHQGPNFKIMCGDNTEHYDSVGPVQCVMTDPPYGEFSHDKERVARSPTGEIDKNMIPFAQLTTENIAALGAYMKTSCEGWTILFSEAEQISAWRAGVEDPERKRPRYFRPMIWVKPDAKPNFKGHGPGMGYETIQAYWCGGGKQSWNGGGKAGVFYHSRNRRPDGGFKHPTEKPVSLMKELVRYFTNPGDTVFDPFMGCGSTGVAALELGRKFIGIEQNPAYYEEALKRLQDADRPTVFAEPEAKIPTLFGDAAFGSTGTRKRLRREAEEKSSAD